jgi:hypothetical protein
MVNEQAEFDVGIDDFLRVLLTRLISAAKKVH